MENSLKGFYNYIHEQGGLRYGHEFLVLLKFPSDLNVRDEISLLHLPPNFSKILNAQGNNNICFPLYVKSSSIPDLELTTADASFLAAGFKFPGIVKYKNSWDVTVQLDQELIIYEALLAWKESMSSYALNTGGSKTIPNVHAEVLLLDEYNSTALRQFNIQGIFPTNLQQISMQYKEGSNTPKTCAVTFAMQWYNEVTPTEDSNKIKEIMKDIYNLAKIASNVLRRIIQ